jgi:tetratricopeptide (TPR) repeat protein
VTVTFLLDDAIDRHFVDPHLPHRGADRADPARARVPHATSLILHVVTTGLVTLLGAEMLAGCGAGALGAAAAGLLFGLHPIHTENVAWVAARADTLGTMLFVLSLLVLIRARRSGSTLAHTAAAGLYLLALLSKENVVVGVVLAPLVLRVHPESSVAAKRLLKPAAFLGGALAVYLVLRWAASGPVAIGPPRELTHAAALGLAALGFYIRKILIPWPLTPLSLSLPGPLATFASLGGAIAVAVAVAASRSRHRRLLLVCLAWFVAACLPVLPLAMTSLTVSSTAERYLYLPSVGFALAGGAVAAALAADGRRLLLAGAAAGLLAVYAATAWSGAATWHDNLSLFTVATRQPQSARHPTPWINLGLAYQERGNPAAAERCFREALGAGVVPNPQLQAGAWYGLGELRRAEAERLVSGGRTAAALERFREAAQDYARALQGDPTIQDFRASRALIKLQLLLLEDGPPAQRSALLREAGEDIDTVARVDPKHPLLPILQGTYRDLAAQQAP